MTDACTVLKAAGAGFPDLVLTRFEVRAVETLTTIAAVEQRIAELDTGHAGWCRRESWVGAVPAASHAGHGPPLDGEWVSDDGGTSLRLMLADGVWRLFTICEPGHGRPALREDVALCGHNRTTLHYALYWAAPARDPAGLRRIACRFTGFGAGGRP
jgi:hypothetical protein